VRLSWTWNREQNRERTGSRNTRTDGLARHKTPYRLPSHHLVLNVYKNLRSLYGTYRGKRLCQTCLMEQAAIMAPKNQMEFERVWHEWGTMLAGDRWVVCAEHKETMILPANEKGTPSCPGVPPARTRNRRAAPNSPCGCYNHRGAVTWL
jgi:hypothetical protein